MASPSGYCGETDDDVVVVVFVVFDARFICVGRAAALEDEAATWLLPPALVLIVFVFVGRPLLPLPSANGILDVANLAMSTATEDFDVYCTCN